MNPPPEAPDTSVPVEETASERFRRRYPLYLIAGLLASVALHVAVLGLSPRGFRPAAEPPPGELQAVRLPPPPPSAPAVKIPPAAEPIPRPEPPAEPGGGPPSPAEEPSFTPHDVPPKLLNTGEITSFLQQFYPPVQKELGVEGRVRLWIYLSEAGHVVETRIQDSSGHEAFDELARTAASLMQFRPAMNHGRPTPLWISQPIRFRLTRDTARRRGDSVSALSP